MGEADDNEGNVVWDVGWDAGEGKAGSGSNDGSGGDGCNGGNGSRRMSVTG